MGRFEDSNDLFGRGTGSSTHGDFVCDFCKTKWNEGNDETEKYDGDSVPYTEFAGLYACFECFEKIEREIIHRMPDILTWYRRFIDVRKKHTETVESLMADIDT